MLRKSGSAIAGIFESPAAILISHRGGATTRRCNQVQACGGEKVPKPVPRKDGTSTIPFRVAGRNRESRCTWGYHDGDIMTGIMIALRLSKTVIAAGLAIFCWLVAIG